MCGDIGVVDDESVVVELGGEGVVFGAVADCEDGCVVLLGVVVGAGG